MWPCWHFREAQDGAWTRRPRLCRRRLPVCVAAGLLPKRLSLHSSSAKTREEVNYFLLTIACLQKHAHAFKGTCWATWRAPSNIEFDWQVVFKRASQGREAQQSVLRMRGADTQNTLLIAVTQTYTLRRTAACTCSSLWGGTLDDYSFWLHL